jgi:hypothetical protein
MKIKPLYAASIGVGVVALLSSIYLMVGRGASASAAIRQSTAAESAKSPAATDEVTRRLKALEARVAASEIAATSADKDSAAPEEAAPPPAAPPSEAHTLAARQTRFQAELDGDIRDGAAQRFEKSVSDFISNQLPGALETNDCRARMCKLTFNHSSGKTREDVSALWGTGPLTMGSWDYLTEDGTRTVAYIGTEGHALPVLDLDGNPLEPPTRR